MTEYYVPFVMEKNHNKNVVFRLKISESHNIVQNTSGIIADIQYINTSGEDIRGNDIYIKIIVNGTVLFDEKKYDVNLAACTDYKQLWNENTVINHNADGSGSLSVSAEVKTDFIVLTQIPLTKGSATFSGQLTPIDTTEPIIKEVTVSANRYGVDAQAKIIAEHSSYSLSNVEFYLYGLTYEQAKNRITYTNEYKLSPDGTYEIVKKKTTGLLQQDEIYFDLDNPYDNYPLNTGTHYSFSVIVTAANGKTTKSDGVFFVPQKVTGISCVNNIEICPGDNIELECSAIPLNAEDTSLIFVSSNTEVATISAEGVLTGINIGTCFITATTVDGNYTAKCLVYVTDTERFPELNEVKDYLSVFLIRDISSAILYIRKELINISINVPDFSLMIAASRSTPVTNIRDTMISMESACRILENSARSGGIQTKSLPVDEQIIDKKNTGWILIVNNWISFLNELHSILNGG